MPEEQNNLFMAVFTDEDHCLEAVKACTQANFTYHDVLAPYAVHGLDRAMGLPFSKITWVTFLCGLGGTSIAFLGMGYISGWDWPLNIGGKGALPFPAMVPIMFELTVLLGGLCTMLALFAFCFLFPGKQARLFHARQTDDRFVVVLEMDEDFSEAKAREIFTANHAEEIRQVPHDYNVNAAGEDD
ncbi:MAG: DUF3341 domain-containing protein [Planctomycetes bacterium]|nr:DUF3341 domain-containing protein [Planctomycetota bacterium]MCW8135561.1 DUF3341 domain-containing protein [Planctomycetota bacterium]